MSAQAVEWRAESRLRGEEAVGLPESRSHCDARLPLVVPQKFYARPPSGHAETTPIKQQRKGHCCSETSAASIICAALGQRLSFRGCCLAGCCHPEPAPQRRL